MSGPCSPPRLIPVDDEGSGIIRLIYVLRVGICSPPEGSYHTGEAITAHAAFVVEWLPRSPPNRGERERSWVGNLDFMEVTARADSEKGSNPSGRKRNFLFGPFIRPDAYSYTDRRLEAGIW